jgi:hypothetical protein
LEISMPLLVDDIDDRVGHAYSGMPDRLYVIDRDGKVAYKGGRGPFGFKSGEMEQALILLLMDQQTQDSQRAGSKTPSGVKAPMQSRVPMLSNEETWKRLPPLENGKQQPLPHWARALAGPLPRTTACMLELDDMHRMKSPLDPRLRAWLRWQAAVANRCKYSEAYALADLDALGPPSEPVKGVALPPDKRVGLFATKMCLAADEVTDEEVAELIQVYGKEKVVAMVLLLAYANFQDRLLLALGVDVEPGGPLKPLGVKFSRQPTEGRAIAPARPRLEPGKTESPVEAIADREWLAMDFAQLQKHMETQRARQPRIPVPSWEEVAKNLPAGSPTNRPIQIRWSRVCMGYQPELAAGWSNCTRAFREESRQDRVFEETLFWVITRSLHCFY